MEDLRILYRESEIQHRIKLLSERVNKDYKNKNLVVLSVLNGSCYFTIDLTRMLKIDHELTFVQLSSYGNNTESSKEVEIKKYWDVILEDKDILIIEDILDTGLSMECLLKALERVEPRSVKIATLIQKPQSTVKANYFCFEVKQDQFLVGFGMDNRNKKRNLTNIYELKTKKQ